MAKKLIFLLISLSLVTNLYASRLDDTSAGFVGSSVPSFESDPLSLHLDKGNWSITSPLAFDIPSHTFSVDLSSKENVGIDLRLDQTTPQTITSSNGAYITLKAPGDTYQFSGVNLWSDEATDKYWAILHRQDVLNEFSILEYNGSTYNHRLTISPGGITSLPYYSTNGFVKFTGTTGTLGVDTNTYLTSSTGATKALDNLASVAINTSLISDTDNTDNLGSLLKSWNDIYGNRVFTTILAPHADGATALQIMKADGATNILSVDTTNSRIGLGLTPTASLDIKSSAINSSLVRGEAIATTNTLFILGEAAASVGTLALRAANSNKVFFTGNGTSYVSGGAMSIGTSTAKGLLNVYQPSSGDGITVACVANGNHLNFRNGAVATDLWTIYLDNAAAPGFNIFDAVGGKNRLSITQVGNITACVNGTETFSIGRASDASNVRLDVLGGYITFRDASGSGTLTAKGFIQQNKDAMYFGSLDSASPVNVYVGGSVKSSWDISGNFTSSGVQGSLELPVQTAKLGHFTAGTSARIDGGQKRWYLLYDAATIQYADFQFTMPKNYNAQTLTVDLMYTMASATSGNVIMNAQVMAMTTADAADLETDSFDTTNTVTSAVPGTAGYPKQATITLANKDSVAAGDIVILRIYRLASDGGDTATGDLELATIDLKW